MSFFSSLFTSTNDNNVTLSSRIMRDIDKNYDAIEFTFECANMKIQFQIDVYKELCKEICEGLLADYCEAMDDFEPNEIMEFDGDSRCFFRPSFEIEKAADSESVTFKSLHDRSGPVFTFEMSSHKEFQNALRERVRELLSK